MTPSTITTILNSAPMIIQGAGKLIKIIREQPGSGEHNDPDKPGVQDLEKDIARIDARLAATDESNIEQIKLIEQLARQNEMLAESVARLNQRINLVLGISILALLVSLGLILYLLR